MKSRLKRGLGSLAMTVAIAFAAPVMAADGPTSQDILNDAQSTGDVLSYGLGPWAQRFSPMTQVNSENVKDLVPAIAS